MRTSANHEALRLIKTNKKTGLIWKLFKAAWGNILEKAMEGFLERGLREDGRWLMEGWRVCQ